MYKLMIETLDSGNEGFAIAEDFDTEQEAWDFWNDESNEWPEMVGVWVELQSITDEFGTEASANVMGIGEDNYNDYSLDNGTHL